MQSILNQALAAATSLSRSYKLAAGACFGLSALFVATAFGTTADSVVLEAKYEDISERLLPPGSVKLLDNSRRILRESTVQRGDSLSRALDRVGIIDAEAFRFLSTDANVAPISRQLAPGKLIRAEVTETGALRALFFPLNGAAANALLVEHTAEGFTSRIHALDSEVRIIHKTATIKHSLFGASDSAGVPDDVAVQLVDIFGGDIDFHRDLRKGDRFSVIYETASHAARQFGENRIIAAEFINSGKSHRAFWFKPDDSQGTYFKENGVPVRKAFLRSPLEFSRITSGFTNSRYHPVLRETRAHRGIDYAAPIGAGVKVTGDGIVEFAGVQGGYGKVIMIRHKGNRLTVYGHLSGFAAGIRKGNRVTQGTIIGYVGATGIATGPHLHYEFRVDGVHRNPLSISVPDAPPLAANQLPMFNTHVAILISGIEAIRDLQVAILD